MLLAALLAASGCYRTATITPSRLPSLDRFQGKRNLIDSDGEAFTLSSESSVVVRLEDGREVGGPFEAIEVRNGFLSAARPDRDEEDRNVDIPLALVRDVRVEVPRPGLTAAAIASAVIGGIAAVAAVVAMVFLAQGAIGTAIGAGSR